MLSLPVCRLPVCHTQVESLKAARAEAKGNPYREYVLDKQLAFVADPSNIAFEELELPQLIQVCGGGRAFMRGRGQGHGERETEGRGGQEGREDLLAGERVQRLLACWGTPLMTGREQGRLLVAAALAHQLWG